MWLVNNYRTRSYVYIPLNLYNLSMAKKQKKVVLKKPAKPHDYSGIDFSAALKSMKLQKPIPALKRKEDLILVKLEQMEQGQKLRDVIFVLTKHHLYLKKNPKMIMDIKSQKRYSLLKHLSSNNVVGMETLLKNKNSYASKAGLQTAVSELNRDIQNYFSEIVDDMKMIVSPANSQYVLNIPFAIEIE